MFCVVGLGNPGKSYYKNRHNAGFLCLEWIAKQNNFIFQKSREYHFAKVILNSSNFIFVKPQTYMNLSGIAVSSVLNYYKIEVEKCLVIVDDIALPFGKIRIRSNGSSGGHNGLKSIENSIGSQNYRRIRIGVGAPKNEELSNFVLSDFNKKEIQLLNSNIFPAIFESILLIENEKIELAMSKFNGIDFNNLDKI